MTALSLMKCPVNVASRNDARAARTPACVQPLRRRTGLLPAAIDHEIARAGEDRARLQAVEAADRMAEMGGVGIADVLRQMREVEVLVSEVEQMPRALPGAEGTEGDTGLLLEQMQEARGRKPDLRRAGHCRQRLPGEAADARDGAHHARIEWTPRQG